VDDDSVTIDTDIGAAAADVSFEVYKVNELVFASSPGKGSLVSADNYYDGCLIHIPSGFGEREENWVTAYDADTRTATLRHEWTVVPDSTSVYEIGTEIPVWLDTVIAWRAIVDLRRIRFYNPEALQAAKEAYDNLMGSVVSYFNNTSAEQGQTYLRERGGVDNEFDAYDTHDALVQ